MRAMRQPVTPGQRTVIRTLTQQEKAIRAKWARRLANATAEAAHAREVLEDLARAFYGGDGPVVMTEDALYEPEPGAGQ